jgi:hypothetical protein
LANVALLPAKRSPRGFDQLQAAIQMCHAYLTHLAEQGRSQEAIKTANRISDLAITDPGKRVFFDHGIDLLNALTDRRETEIGAVSADTKTKETWRERLPVMPATLEGAQPSSTSATNGFSGVRVSTVIP